MVRPRLWGKATDATARLGWGHSFGMLCAPGHENVRRDRGSPLGCRVWPRLLSCRLVCQAQFQSLCWDIITCRLVAQRANHLQAPHALDCSTPMACRP